MKSSHLPLPKMKWGIIVLQFLTTLLVCTLQGFPQGIQSLLLSDPYNFSNLEYGIFYGITTFPNIILPIFLGLYIDKHGIELYLVVILQTCLLLGTSIITLGSYDFSYLLMVFGRLLLGFGTENIQLVIQQIMLKLSTKEETSKIWGMNLASKRIAIWLSGITGPLMYSWTNSVPVTFSTTVVFAFLACFTFTLSYYLCLKASIFEGYPKDNSKEDEEITMLHNKGFHYHIKEFSKNSNIVYWLIILISVINFTMRYGLMSEINTLIENASNVSALEAGYFLGFYCILSATFQIAWGFLFSNLGYYVYAQIIGCILQLIATFLFVAIFDMDSTYSSLLPLSVWAIGYSMGIIFNFSSIAFVVNKKHYGVAYGIYQSTTDFGATFGPIIFGYIRDVSMSDMSGFFWPLIETAGLQIFALFLGILVLFLDIHGMKVLSQKRNKKLEIEQNGLK